MSDEQKTQSKKIQDELAELVRKELIHVSELQHVEERLKVISEKASKVTATPRDEAPQRPSESGSE
jgi:hypothetical protein